MNAETATPRLTAFPPPLRRDHPPPSNQLLPVRTAYTAFFWVVFFFAFHIYWYAGGSFGMCGSGCESASKLIPHTLLGWISGALGLLAWPLGAWVCLAVGRGWPHGSMRRAALIVIWLGCTVLVLRGGAGLIDDLTRAVGLLPHGITGLSHKQAMGAAYYRSTSVIWSNNIIDGYFLAGGLLFGVLAHRYRTARPEARQEAPSWTSS